VLDTVPRGRSVKARDAVILLLLHVLYMYMVSIIIGDVESDGAMTRNSSFLHLTCGFFMRAKGSEGKGRLGMDKIVSSFVLFGDLRQIAWIILTCERWTKVFVGNCGVCQPGQAAVSRQEMRLREGLGDACNRVLQSGISKERKGQPFAACVLGVESGG
jgi:hypothetical protein